MRVNDFNLLAPHLTAETPFDTVFGGSGNINVFSSAITWEREVQATSGGSTIDASPPDPVLVFESRSVPPGTPAGDIDPRWAYWVRVASTSPAPVIVATGPLAKSSAVARAGNPLGSPFVAWRQRQRMIAFGPSVMLLGRFEVEGSGRAEVRVRAKAPLRPPPP